MNIVENVSLDTHSTMRLGGKAKYLTEVATKQDLIDALAWADEHRLPTIMIGSGSNIIWGDSGYPGLVLVNKISGFDSHELADGTLVTIGSGELLDNAIERSINLGLSGMEQLSYIPGTVGATPIQNVGAYGRETKDILVSLEAYDKKEKKFVTIENSDCGFGYRTSRFKTTDRGRFCIVSVTFMLTKTNPEPPFYNALQQYFDSKKISKFTPQAVRDAVIAIRTSKLPDPAKVANNGSFFANPVVSHEVFQKLIDKYPDMPNWPMDTGRVKLAAGWLVEHAGYKDMHDKETGMATWGKQSLVLVNEHAKSTADLEKFKQKITDAVWEKFGVSLEQEPELVS